MPVATDSLAVWNNNYATQNTEKEKNREEMTIAGAAAYCTYRGQNLDTRKASKQAALSSYSSFLPNEKRTSNERAARSARPHRQEEDFATTKCCCKQNTKHIFPSKKGRRGSRPSNTTANSSLRPKIHTWQKSISLEKGEAGVATWQHHRH